MDSSQIFSDILKLIEGQFGGGIHSIVAMLPTIVVGVVLGIILHKAFKYGIIALIVAAVAVYLGFVSLSTIEGGAKDLVAKYGPVAQSYIAVFLGLVPLSIGLVIGIVVGFVI